MSMYLTDEMLARAAKSVGETMLASLPDPEDCRHAFSPEFERSMERLIQKAKRKTRIRRCLQSIAVAALAVVIGLSAWLAVDTEARAAMVEWVRTVYEDSIVYEFFHPGAVEDDSSYRLGWVPDGYALLQEETGELMYIAVYQRKARLFTLPTAYQMNIIRPNLSRATAIRNLCLCTETPESFMRQMMKARQMSWSGSILNRVFCLRSPAISTKRLC